MRFALRSTKDDKSIIGEVNENGTTKYKSAPFYYTTLRGVIAAANRRHQYMHGGSGQHKFWFAVTIVGEQFPRPEPVFTMVTDTSTV